MRPHPASRRFERASHTTEERAPRIPLISQYLSSAPVQALLSMECGSGQQAPVHFPLFSTDSAYEFSGPKENVSKIKRDTA